jgi:hypothetical protein
MRYVLFILIYLIIDIVTCSVINSWIEKWLLNRAYEKWGVRYYHKMTKKHQDWFETRQTIYESAWDMIASVILVVVFFNIFPLDIQ